MAAKPGWRFTRLNRNSKRHIDLGARNLVRFPCDIVCAPPNPYIHWSLACVLLLKLVGGRFWTSGIDVPLETSHDRGVPCCVEFLGAQLRFDQDAIAAKIFIVSRMQRLMEVGNEMNQEC